MKSIATLLAPVSDEAPCGVDLDESIEFDILRSAFDLNFPIDSGVSPLADGEPGPMPVVWAELFSKIEALFTHTKDLWLAVSYARCGFVLSDPVIVSQGLELTARLLEESWESVHPLVDDPNGRPRATIFEDIARRGAFALPFRHLPVLSGPRGSIRAGQLIDLHQDGAASDLYVEVRGLLDALDDESKMVVADQLAAMLSQLARIEAVLRQHDATATPDFSIASDTIRTVHDAYRALAGLAEAAADEELPGSPGHGVDGASAAPAAGSGGRPRPFSASITSRDEVMKALNAIEAYYVGAEPGHPMRLAMGRLRRWVNMDFIEILEDIAPQSLDDVKSVLLERRDMK